MESCKLGRVLLLERRFAFLFMVIYYIYLYIYIFTVLLEHMDVSKFTPESKVSYLSYLCFVSTEFDVDVINHQYGDGDLIP